MGCDIHFFVEHRKNDKWEAVKEPSNFESHFGFVEEWSFGRDYDLFSLLAHVRRNDLPLIGGSIKKLPNDLSDDVICGLQLDKDVDYYPASYHTHNWLTLTEILNFNWNALYKDGIPEWVENFKGEQYTYADRFDYFIKEIVEPMKVLDNNPDNIRCVYGFDG